MRRRDGDWYRPDLGMEDLHAHTQVLDGRLL
jgi:hypothetical protein